LNAAMRASWDAAEDAWDEDALGNGLIRT